MVGRGEKIVIDIDRFMANDKNPEKELSFAKRVALELLWGTCRVIHYTPRWFRYYIFKPFIYAILRLLRYRLKIIMRNLELCFPEKSPKERKQLAHKYYKSLAEIIVDTISLAGVSKRRNSDIITWTNRDEHLKRIKDTDWVALCGHYGCWEYYLLWCWEDPNARFMGVYHTLRNSVFECFYRRLRAYDTTIDQVPMQDTVRFYLRNRGKGHNIAIGLISDQSPKLSVDTEWYDFFGQPTAFVEGGAHIATKFSLPIYFVHSRRVAPGRYECRFDLVYDGKEDVDIKEITRRYASHLESMIKESPELWLWSHHRWRYTPERQEKLRQSIKNR